MTSENFCFWLQGYFEITGTGYPESLEPEQVEIIERHLNLVFAVEPNADKPFCTWLRNALELVSKEGVEQRGVQLIKAKLNECFEHVIDPNMGDQAQQDKLNAIHTTDSIINQNNPNGGWAVRC